MTVQKMNWKIVGAAGMGIVTAGRMWAKAMNRAGKWVHGYLEYPSLIRGGHNTYQVLAADEVVKGPVRRLDVLVALNQEGVDNHLKEIDKNTTVIGDESLKMDQVEANVIQIPLRSEAEKIGGEVLQNTIGLGASAAAVGLEVKILEELVEEFLGDKSELVEANKKALRQGFKMNNKRVAVRLNKKGGERAVMSGNEAVALGAISAGVDLYGAYPMTPATSVMHYLADKQEQTGMIVRQTEDEISAINMCLGASFAGAKAMTGTSGGGLALMQESISLAGMLELPLVVFMAMRAGPATGMPTWSSQADLRFVIHAGHGEFNKIVLAPGDLNEAFELTREAVDLAQKFQTVVFVISDKFLAESVASVEWFDEKNPIELQNITLQPEQPEGKMFHRYQPNPRGVSVRTLPGVTNGEYIANSDEHGPRGLVSEEVSRREVANKQRSNKLESIKQQMKLPIIYGDHDAEVSLVCWGSNKGPVMDVLSKWSGKVNMIHFSYIWPMPGAIEGMLKGKKLLSIENNNSSQLAGLLKQEFGVDVADSLNKDTGRPFYAEEIVKFVEKNL